jgi:hypothetical protein
VSPADRRLTHDLDGRYQRIGYRPVADFAVYEFGG